MAKDVLNWLFGKAKEGGARQAPPYEKAREIASSGSEKQRTKLAGYEDLEPEFLYYFATDKSPAVRKAVAGNEGTPLQADLILAKDPNDAVRLELAGKIGKLIPELSARENEKVTEMAMQVLEVLARDELPKVRAIIAEETKHLDYLPKDVVNRLARDAEEAVSAPILEFSPLLNDSELIQIIAGGIQCRRRDRRRTGDPGAPEELLGRDWRENDGSHRRRRQEQQGHARALGRPFQFVLGDDPAHRVLRQRVAG
jgi:hypothetical protein